MNMNELRAGASLPPPRRQRGVITVFTGVLILIMMTLMMYFAVRVGVFEQRVSSNELRQKLAFHAAESGIEQAKEFLLANNVLVASSTTDLLPDGTDGWLATGAERWQKCSEASGIDLDTGSGSHPCFGEPVTARRSDLYYYSFNGSNEIALNTDAILPGDTEQVDVHALLCVMEMDFDASPPVQGCSTDTPGSDDITYYMVTILARGQADCSVDGCGAEVLMSELVANFGAVAGGHGPAVPLTSKSTFPPSGSAEVVPNPNAGGVGVPTSIWVNANARCEGHTPVDPTGGSWATCEAHEWYGVDSIPDGIACTGNCACTEAESISYTHGSSETIGIDVEADPDFPCDLFEFYFGIPREDYEVIKSTAKIITDCTTLGPNTFGLVWISGPECRVNANTTIGSPEAPVLMISAASLTRFNGGANVFGVLYIADVEDLNAEFQSLGTNTVYGSVVVDGTLGSYQGTFQFVYHDLIVTRASSSGGLGSVTGGWSDFHQDWQ
jgi:Tfp pilus assembly protein PilX